MRDDTDPTRLTNQPALTTSNGNIWLIVGGLFTLIALGVLISLNALPPEGLAITAAAVVALLYCGMLLARAWAPPGRPRLTLLAVGLLLIAAVSLISVGTVAATAAT